MTLNVMPFFKLTHEGPFSPGWRLQQGLKGHQPGLLQWGLKLPPSPLAVGPGTKSFIGP